MLGELGRGAMGIVYRAKDPIINRRVALKTITTGLSDNPVLLERFYREAQSAGGLQHPNIVTIYDMGEADGIPYIAMEFIEGESLEGAISRRDNLALALKLSWAIQACRALDYAHKRGIIHRDIKPANLMVNSEGTVKVVDFGIARVLEASKTQTGMLIGTFAYMSPEQYQGEHADERSDIWSFGVLLYELLSYQRPFAGKTPASVMHAICHLEPAPISQKMFECPTELQQLMDKILMKSPVDRYQSMEDLLLDLEPICKTLQAATVTEWVAEAEERYENQDFTHAHERLKQALQIESSNHRARALLEKVNAELKRITLRPQAQSHVEKGLALLAEGKVQEAKTEAEASLQLDSRYEPAQELHQKVLRELERWQLIAEWLESAGQFLAEGILEQAEEKLAKVLELDPRNRDALQLQQQAAKQKSERERRLYLFRTLQQARAFWTQQDYGRCIEILAKLQHEFPGEVEVTRLLETAKDDQAEQGKRQKLISARNMLAAGQYGDCKRLLSELRQEFPADEHVSGLFNQCQKDEQNQIRVSGLKQARSLLAARRYEECAVLLNQLKAQFPQEDEIRRLLEAIQKDRAVEELQAQINRARKFLSEHNYAECGALLVSLAKRYPNDSDIAELQTILQQEESEQRKVAALSEVRNLLFEKRYEDSLELLSKLQKDFPEDREQIPKLLETARADFAEIQKQTKISEARALLASEKFSDAVQLLEDLQKLDPKDSAIQKLMSLASTEQEKQAKQQRLQIEWGELKHLAAQKKYAEIVAHGEELLQEFPGDDDLIRFVQFARAQQTHIERDSKLRAILEEFNRLKASNRLEEAIRVGKKGLATFPGNPELLSATEQAELQFRKLQTRRSIEQRMREIKVKINREKYSEAVELAKQTLLAYGADTALTQLLNSAQIELETKKKKKEQQKKIEAVQQYIQSGKLDDATATLMDAVTAGSLEHSDPRVQQALQDIEDRKAVVSSQGVPETEPLSPANEYALFQGPPVEPDISKDAATAIHSSAEPKVVNRISSDPVVEKVPAPVIQPPKIAPVEPKKEPVTQTKKGKPAQEARKAKSAPVAAPSKQEVAPPSPPVALVPRWRKPIFLPVYAVLLGLLVWAGVHFTSSKPRSENPANPTTTATVTEPATQPKENPLEIEQRRDLVSADHRIAAGKLDDAISILKKSAAKNGPLTADIQKKVQGLEAALQNADLRKIQQSEATMWQQANTSLNEGKYKQAEAELRQILALPEGATRKQEAKEYIDQVIPRRAQEQKLFADAQRASRENDAQGLRKASDLASKVIAIGGPRRADAIQLKAAIDTKLARLDQDQKGRQIADLQNSARQSIRSGDIPAARSKSEQIRSLGGDGSSLSVEIDQAEKSRNAEATFQDAMQHYRQAVNDKGALEAARMQLQAIADGGGPHASEARNSADEIKTKLAKLNQPANIPPSRTPETAVSPSTADHEAITGLVKRYFRAFSDRDAGALRSVWPTMTSKQYNGYKASFENASSINMLIQSQNIDFGPDGLTATVNTNVTQEYTPKKQAMKSVTASYVLQFSKKDGNWAIASVR